MKIFDKIRITADELIKSEILEAVSEQVRVPNSNLADCREWSNWDWSGIYFVHSNKKCARVWIDEETYKATRCELL